MDGDEQDVLFNRDNKQMTFSEALAISGFVVLALIAIGMISIIVLRDSRESKSIRGRLGRMDFQEIKPLNIPKDRLTGLVRLGNEVSLGKFSSSLQSNLLKAGFYGPNGPAIYIGSKIALLLLGIALSGSIVVLLAETTATGYVISLLVCGILFFAPNVYVAHARKIRRFRINKNLPAAIDMVEVCVTSGMSLDAAWDSVGREIREVDEVISDEMELTTLETALGTPRPDAMRNMAVRTGVSEISTLVGLLIQADRFGSSLSVALKTFALSIRESHSQRAEEAAQKMAVKMLIPMVVFILPSLLIVVCGPAALSLARNI
jgi:tight adherence protein C